MRVQRRQPLSLIAGLLLSAGVAASSDVRDPHFGEALFYAHQGDYFRALERLDSELDQHYRVDERSLDRLYSQIGDAEFSVGDFELRYRMHQRAGRAIRAVLEGNVADRIKADAAYRLARLHFQKGQPADALRVLDGLGTDLPPRLREDVDFLRANVLMALDRPEQAVSVLRALQDADRLLGFSAYNLGIALLESGDAPAALAQLDRAGRIPAKDRETWAIRDKSNFVLGTLLLDADQRKLAQRSLDRVRVEGPFSNRALLRAGWAEASVEDYERAVVPWSILAARDTTDPAVQEALLALPYAYGRLDIHGRAAVLYEQAARAFGEEVAKLDASLASVETGRFLRLLDREELRQDRDWVVRMRELPDSPETFYLISLLASNEFQTALQNYLDLADLKRKLVGWQASLDAFEDLIRLRRAYYEPRLPEIDREFRRLDAQMRLRLEQRRHVDERLTRMLTTPAPELLATAEEHALRTRLSQLAARVDEMGDGTLGRVALRRRMARLRGLLEWDLETQYHERLTEVHAHLRVLNADVARLETRYEAFVRSRQAATHSYEGYGSNIVDLRGRVSRSLDRLGDLRARQGVALEQVAVRELRHRRDRLAAYQNKARFAFADSYDRAAKTQAR